MIGSLKRAFRSTAWYGKLQQRRWRRDAASAAQTDAPLRAFYRQFVPERALCFDVGANVGNRTRVFLALGATVVAVEPQDDCIAFLRETYGEDSRLTIIDSVLGAADGEAELIVSEVNTLSSLSPHWIESVKESGRFADHAWRATRQVRMTTLDRLIERFGVPAFVKIDVEGFEAEVVRGLSRPVGALSVEFAPEGLEGTLACIEHLRSLGDIELNYSAEESMRMQFERWIAPAAMVDHLRAFGADTRVFGDVYVRFGR